MDFVITSDIQLHPHQPWSKILPNGMNDRLADGLECLRQAFDLVKGASVIVNGDLFHDRKALTLDTIHYTRQVFDAHPDTDVILSVGNHDQFSRVGDVHSLGVCSGRRVSIVSKPDVIHLQDITVYVIPFIENAEEFKRVVAEQEIVDNGKMHLLLMHQGIDGALLAKNSRAKDKISLSDLRLSEFDLVLSGHYHRPQQMASNMFYIGSPYEIDAGEAGDEKRFLVLGNSPPEGASEVWSGAGFHLYSVPVRGMPRHLTFKSVSDYKQSSYYGGRNFVTIECGDDVEVREVTSLDIGARAIPRPTVAEGGSVATDGEISVEASLRAFLASKGRDDLLEVALGRISS